MTIMTTAEPIPQRTAAPRLPDASAPRYAVSWGAITAGTLAAAAASLVLLTLGSGLGLAIVSPWPGSGTSASTFAVSAAIGLVVVQWLSSGLGGYVAGRLHVQVPGAHDDEVYFRDTAHGFLAWALSTLVVAVLLGTGLVSAVTGAGSAVGSTVSGIATIASRSAPATATNTAIPTDYAVDLLFRPTSTQAGGMSGATPGVDQSPADRRGEAGRILVDGMTSGQLSNADKSYLGHLVATSTGMSEADAQKRVDDTVAQWNQAKLKVRQDAEIARKSAMSMALMTALAMVVGAFVASAAGALGGIRRDAYVALTRRVT